MNKLFLVAVGLCCMFVTTSHAGVIDSIKNMLGSPSETVNTGSISYLGFTPGDSLERIQGLDIFKKCKRDAGFEKKVSAPEVWFCKSLNENVGAAVLYFWRKKLAIANFVFCSQNLKFSPLNGFTETEGMMGDAVICSFIKNQKQAAMYSALKKEFEKIPTQSKVHINGLMPPRDLLCANGTNRLQCEYDVWQDAKSGTVAIVGSHLNDEERREADQLRLSATKLEEELMGRMRNK